jgi:DNA helicase-2/ATP-dependent DNA helicase PcrA
MSREYVLQPFHRASELHIDYAREVNEQQLAAVTAPPGPALVIAGAGSGKTRTLTYRVAYLLEQGIPADRILLLTFTNKAAREMMRRVVDLLGEDRSDLWGGTFHSIGNRILRLYAEKLGYGKDFSILDQEDARHLISTCIAESNIDTKATRFPKAEVLGSIFSLAANKRMPVAEIVGQQFDYFLKLLPQIEQVHAAYAGRKQRTGAMDFDDLLVLWLRLMEEHADVREFLQRRFQFTLVDEYQDTNQLQGDLIDLLAARTRNVMAVGDDAQSIYGWRGANFENILQFPTRYPGAAVYKIETNYRSTPEILTLANAVIRGNARQFAKELAPAKPPGMKPVLVACQDARQQAAFVAQRVLELREEGRSLESMAILYRSHFHALELQLELTQRNIPFSITSGVRFFEQAHVKDVTAHLKFVVNPRDELSFKRMVQLLSGIGARGAEKLWREFEAVRREAATKAAQDSAAATVEPAARHTLAAALQQISKTVAKKARVGWAQFTATVAQVEEAAADSTAGRLINIIVEAGYEDYLKANFENYPSRLDDLEQLGIFSEQFESMTEFLTQLALLTNIEAEEAETTDQDTERLRLSTIHQAKGLEFDVVFVIMLCDGMFPSARSLDTDEGVEEERRLMYVSVTRARDELYLSYPLIRAMAGGGMDQLQRPSRFLGEIPEDAREEWDLVNGGHRNWNDDADEIDDDDPDW